MGRFCRRLPRKKERAGVPAIQSLRSSNAGFRRRLPYSDALSTLALLIFEIISVIVTGERSERGQRNPYETDSVPSFLSLRFIAPIVERSAVESILTHLKLPTAPALFHQLRAPPQGALWDGF